MSKRIHTLIPEQPAEEINTLVGKRGRNGSLAETACKEVRTIRMLNTLEEASGAWKDKYHPELKGGAARYVEKLRKEDERRFERITER